MWKFHHFSITQILREINFGYLEVQDLPFFTYLEALNFEFCEFLHFCDVIKFQIFNKVIFIFFQMPTSHVEMIIQRGPRVPNGQGLPIPQLRGPRVPNGQGLPSNIVGYECSMGKDCPQPNFVGHECPMGKDCPATSWATSAQWARTAHSPTSWVTSAQWSRTAQQHCGLQVPNGQGLPTAQHGIGARFLSVCV